MKVLGKFITTQSDFDPQPVFIIELDHVSIGFRNKVLEGIENRQEYILIGSTEYDELMKNNMFEQYKFPVLIEAYMDFVV